MDGLFQKLFSKYAQLVVKTGVNIQPGQILVISSPIECSAFARAMAEAAYLEGARDVVMKWNDEPLKASLSSCSGGCFRAIPAVGKRAISIKRKNNAAFISIAASDPELMRDGRRLGFQRLQKPKHCIKGVL